MNKPDKIPAVAKAQAAWGEAMPDWVLVLAQECDRTSQNAAAKRIDYSSAAVSQVINNCYKAPSTSIEQAVRGALMAAVVACPVVGDLAADTCLTHQKAPWAPHNPQRIAFWRACRGGCPHSRVGGGNA